MAVDQTFRAIITVVDRTVAPLRQINDRLEAMREPVRAVTGSVGGLTAEFARLGRSTGLSRISQAAGEAMARVRGLAGQITGLVAPLAALGAVGSVGGLLSIVHGAAEAGGALNDLYTQLGAASDQQRSILGGLRYSAQQAGATAEDVTGAVSKLSRNLADAARGGNDGLAALFRRLRIPMRDANGQIRSAIDLLPELAEAFERNRNPTVRTAMAVALFGKSGASLIPAMVEMRENAERLRSFGKVFSREDIANLDAFGDAFHDVRMAVNGVRNAIGAQLAPVLTPLLENLAHWIAANRELVASAVREFVTDLSARIRAFDWKGFFAGASRTVETIGRMVRAMGGMKTVLIATAAVVAGPFLASIVGVTRAIAALTVAVVTNPIGAAITLAIAGIAGAAYLIWRNWSGIVGFFSRIWERIRNSEQFKWLRGALTDNFLATAAKVRTAWEGLVWVFQGVWKGITDPFVEMWNTIRPILEELGIVGQGGSSQDSAPASPEMQRERRNRFRDRGAAGGFYQPSSFQPGAPARGAVDIRVRFENAPSGLRAETSTSGVGLGTAMLDVGYAFRTA